MKKALWLLLLILSFSVVTAQSVYDYQELTLQHTISNQVVIKPTRSDYQVEYFKTTLQLFPESSYRQNILDIDFSPVPDNDGVFVWNNPSSKVLPLSVSATIKTSNAPIMIKEKVDFPIETIPLSVKEYVLVTETIDTSPAIRRTAQDLAQGVDDLFVLEHRLARWVNQHIEYNLSSSTAEANYPASWVIENEYGVCDELTNLFIALNRALGIPARFVSGIAYTDSELFANHWGNHGWAEVYFPGYGWIPYDVTYQEYGQVDATHIALQKKVDGAYPSVEYTTRGLYYDFEPSPLSFDTQVISYGAKRQPKAKLTVNAIETSVSFGSYNLLEVTLTNPHDYYVVEDVTLARALELEYFADFRKSVVLAPYESTQVYWLVKVDENLDDNYLYTFPVTVFGASGGEAQTAFSVAKRSQTYDENYMSQFIQEEQEESSSVSVDCEYKSSYLVTDDIIFTCVASSVVDSFCLLDDCEYNTDTASFTITNPLIGITTTIIETTDDQGTKKHFFSYEVLDQAQIYIEYVTINQDISFEDFATLKVKLVKNSSANPTNVSMRLVHEMLQKEWYFSFLETDKTFDIQLPGQGFVIGENEFTILVSYVDSTGETHELSKSVQANLQTNSPMQKVIAYYNTYGSKVINSLERLGLSRSFAETLTPGIIIVLIFFVASLVKFGISRAISLAAPKK